MPRRLLPFRKWALAVLVACMSAYPVFKAVLAQSGDRAPYFEIAFWPLAALALVLSSQKIDVNTVDRYFSCLFFYALASNSVEVFLFFTIGRLPALAYANSFSVRFGGFLDDPNGFSALLYMLMGWAYFRFSGKTRFFAEAALLLCVLLSQSLTAVGFLGMLLLWSIGYNLVRRPKPLRIISTLIALAIVLFFFWPHLAGLVSAVAEERQGSASAHLSQVSYTKMGTDLDWLFGISFYESYESWWFSSVVDFGVPWSLLTVGVIGTLALTVLKHFRHARDVHTKAMIAGVLLLSCYFIVGNINLPFFKIFPISFLFFFFTFLIFFDRIRKAPAPVRSGTS